MLVAFTTSSLIDPTRYHISGELGKLYGNPLGELYVSDNEQRAQFFPTHIGVTAGEGDFTVTYASGNMIAAAGLPFTPSDENVVFIKRVPATGSAETYTKRTNDIRYWTNTFQVTSASFSASDHFIVGLYGKEKAYDPVADAQQVEQVNAQQLDYTDGAPVSSSIVFGTAGWFSGTVWIDTKGMTTAKLFLTYGFSGAASPGANTLYMKMLGSYDTTASDEFDECQVLIGTGSTDIQQNLYTWTPRTWNNTTASYFGYKKWRTYFEYNVDGLTGFRVALSESIGAGSTTGTLDVYYKLTNSGK